MGDYKGIPLPDNVKTGLDAVVIPSALVSWMASISWPTIAAFLACVYTGLRIVELLHGWAKKRRK